MHTANLHWDFTIPFPESLDQYLPGSSVFGLGQASSSSASAGLSLDVDIDSIDGMIWPEATSAWYLSSVLQQLSGTAPPTQTDRNMLSGAITAHTINVMSGNWKRGDRTAAVGTNFMYTPSPPCPLSSTPLILPPQSPQHPLPPPPTHITDTPPLPAEPS